MSLDEAVRHWVSRDFSLIPTQLVQKAYKDNPEELELLSSSYPEYAYPCAHGWMFHPEWGLDQDWIKDNINDVEECGFLVYDTEEAGVLLALDSGGYDFFSEHWLPLYKKRGLRWHQ